MTTLAKDEVIKSDILDEAAKLFRHYGLQKTTMEDIAKAVGKGKSTLYYYYKNKEEIFDAVIRKEKNMMFRNIQEAVSREESAVKKLEAFTRSKMREIRRMTTLYQVVASEIKACNELEVSIRRHYDCTETEILKSILHYGVITGEFPNYDQQELETLAFLLANAQRGVETALIMDQKLEEIGEMMDVLVTVLMNGIKKS
jgi:AcrR family transcriptional regulator